MKAWFLVILLAQVQTKRHNVLFLMVDDLRANLGIYQMDRRGRYPGSADPVMHTPVLDSLARESLLLTRAYVQMALCSPSRTSILTGRRPDTTHIYDLQTYFRSIGNNFTTIPQYFAQNGYHSIGIGKIFHPNNASGKDDPLSWSEPYKRPQYNAMKEDHHTTWKAIPRLLYQSQPLKDQLIAKEAQEKLAEMANKFDTNGQPFFLAVGFIRPHLPFICPEKYFRWYPLGKVNLPNNPYPPKGMPEIAWSNYGELHHKYEDVIETGTSGEINCTLPDYLTLNLRRAYFACVSYIDDLIGDILTELKDQGLERDTIVVFMGDHGWQLGEHGEWCKHTNFELATHAPLFIKIPGLTDTGVVSDALVEFVDIFPTLVEATGLPLVPVCPSNTNADLCHEGRSLIPLVQEPSPQHWRFGAFSQYDRKVLGDDVMGYTIRTNRFRYTEWVSFAYSPKYAPDWNVMHGIELYDHKYDPDENYNVAADAQYVDIQAVLSTALRAGWRGDVSVGINNSNYHFLLTLMAFLVYLYIWRIVIFYRYVIRRMFNKLY